MPNDLAARALSAELTVTRGDYFDAGLTQPVPDGTLAGGQTTHLVLSGGTAGDTIDPNTKMSYIDEFIVGMIREVLPQHERGRQLHSPQHRPRARRRRKLSDGGVLRRRDLEHLHRRDLHPDESDQRDADQPGRYRRESQLR